MKKIISDNENIIKVLNYITHSMKSIQSLRNLSIYTSIKFLYKTKIKEF